MMKTWTLQKGFPLVTVQKKGKQLFIQQERFFLNMKPEIQPSDTRYMPSFFSCHLFCTLSDHKFLWNLTRLSLPRNSLTKLTFLPIFFKKTNKSYVTNWNNSNFPIFSLYSYLWHIPLSYVTEGRNYSKYQSVSLLDKKSGLTIMTVLIGNGIILKIGSECIYKITLAHVDTLWIDFMSCIYKMWLMWDWFCVSCTKLALAVWNKVQKFAENVLAFLKENSECHVFIFKINILLQNKRGFLKYTLLCAVSGWAGATAF